MKKLIDFLVRLFTRKPEEPQQPEARQPAITGECVTLIKHYEGMKLRAYKDMVGVWTIGYGHTGPEVHSGLVWTPEQAEQALRDRLDNEFVPGVLKALTKRPQPCELDAMVSLAYNVGVGAFSNSTLVKKYNAGDTDGAAEQFHRWTIAEGKSVKGLRRRRAAEAARFAGATAAEAIAIGALVK